MKIAAIPASIRTNNNNESNARKSHKSNKKITKKQLDSSSNSSCCSGCSGDSDSDSSSRRCNALKMSSRKEITSRNTASNRITITKSSKIISERKATSSESASDTSDAESSDCSLRIASRLLENKNINCKNVPNKNMKKPMPTDQLGGDGASSSDMELPALVNAAIQRVESFSDGENSKTEPSNTQYTSSLLHEFMVKTQMLGSTMSSPMLPMSVNSSVAQNEIKTESPVLQHSIAAVHSTVKRKRGRPPKKSESIALPTSESPDSGITSTPHSPVQMKGLESRSTSKTLATTSRGNIPPTTKKSNSTSVLKKGRPASAMGVSSMPKLNIVSLEKTVFATDRVLYPPRRKKRDVSASSTKSLAAPAA